MKRWWRCAKQGHPIEVHGPTIIKTKVVVRCACGRGVRPRLVQLQPLDIPAVKDWRPTDYDG